MRDGIPERVAMQMTGHRTRDVFERYNIVRGGDLTDAARKLDAAAAARKVTADDALGTIAGTIAPKEGGRPVGRPHVAGFASGAEGS